MASTEARGAAPASDQPAQPDPAHPAPHPESGVDAVRHHQFADRAFLSATRNSILSWTRPSRARGRDQSIIRSEMSTPTTRQSYVLAAWTSPPLRTPPPGDRDHPRLEVSLGRPDCRPSADPAGWEVLDNSLARGGPPTAGVRSRTTRSGPSGSTGPRLDTSPATPSDRLSDRVMTSTDPLARELRQNSPFLLLLSEAERRKVLAAFAAARAEGRVGR